MPETKLVAGAIGLTIAILIFFLLWGNFGSTILDNTWTIHNHSNMSDSGETIVENTTTMYALLGFIFIVVVIVGLFKKVGVV